MAESPFVLPDFLEVDEDEIHERMLRQVPSNFDVSEGSLFWDLTRPTAMEKAEMLGFELAITVMNMFPQFAEKPFLDHHAKRDGVERRPAVAASGEVTFTGVPGTEIPIGTVVSTSAEETTDSIMFRTTETGIIGEGGTVVLPVIALTPGLESNVPAGAITNIEEPITGVQAIVNESPTLGGADEESDESLRTRILDRNRNKELSGSRRDYERWAKEVAGVGDVIVVPEWNGPGTVKVMITAADGGVATNELIQAVQAHIAPDGRQGGGLAPIGALVTVDSVNIKPINIAFTAYLVPGYSAQSVVEKLKSSLHDYFSSLSIGGLIRHTHVGSLIIQTEGIRDYENLLLNGLPGNVQLADSEVASVGAVSILEK